MKIKIALHPKAGIVSLPVDYKRILSAAVWTKLSEPSIKESSFPTLLSISPLFFKNRELRGDSIEFRDRRGSFSIGAAHPLLVEKLTNLDGELEVGGNLFEIGDLSIEPTPLFPSDNRLTWVTSSGGGICTLKRRPEGVTAQNRHWILPSNNMEDVVESLISSLNTKWNYFCTIDKNKASRFCESENPIEWAKSNQPSLKVEMLKNNFHHIKSGVPIGYWRGRVEVDAHPAWQRLIHDCGLGNKTGMGYGYVEVAKPSKN
jgi:CRISPR-associated endoribonuclease Cas6